MAMGVVFLTEVPITHNYTLPIEHKLFSPISRNWRTQPLESFETVVNYIAHTTTATGLKVKAALAKVNIERNAFQGMWNYVIKPTSPTAESA